MGRFLAAVAALVALIAAILYLIPHLVNAERFKGTLEETASNALGRTVEITGPIDFRVFPSAAFAAEEVTISNPEGFAGAYFARMERAEIGVAVLPLLQREVALKKFVLVAPEINLERRSDGSANWEFTPVEAQPDTESAPAQSGVPSVRDARFGDVRIADGKATYTDALSDSSYAAEDIDLTIRLENFDKPVEATGTMTFQGAPARVDLVIATLRKLQDGEASSVQLDAVIDDARIGADLNVTNADDLAYSGEVMVEAPDLDSLASLFGVSLAEAPGFDSFSMKGDAEGGASSARIRNAAIVFDAIDATGDLGFNWSGAKPKAEGSLQIPTLDLRPYLPPPPPEAASGFPAWSDAPMAFDSLRNIDASLEVSADAVRLHDIETGEGRMTITIDNGRLTADIPQLNLYNGGGSGRLVVNARRATPSFAGYFDFRAIDAQPLTLDVLKRDLLLGAGALQFEFTASGASQAAIMSSVDGKGGFDLNDGAINGVNIVKLVNAARSAYGSGGVNPSAIVSAVTAARSPTDATDYSKFLSAFNITNGLVNAPTIQLEGPYISMTGRGLINLPAQSIDIQLLPTVTTTPDGQEGSAYAVPIKVGGTFSEPSYGVDAEALLRSGLEGQGRQLLEQALGLGGSENADGAEAAGEESEETSLESAASSLLRGLFEQPSVEEDGSEDPQN